MKTLLKTVALLALFSASVHAETYTSDPERNIEVSNNGRNTYIAAMPGLIVNGATADGDRLILPGTPNKFYGTYGGQRITISKLSSLPPQERPSSKRTDALQARLNNLEHNLQQKQIALYGNDVVKVMPKEPAKVWEIRKTDVTLFGALSRWSELATPKRQLLFETDDKDFPIIVETSFTGDYDSAVLNVIESLKSSSYPLRACMWDNKPRPVVKLIHKNKSCED